MALDKEDLEEEIVDLLWMGDLKLSELQRRIKVDIDELLPALDSLKRDNVIKTYSGFRGGNFYTLTKGALRKFSTRTARISPVGIIEE